MEKCLLYRGSYVSLEDAEHIENPQNGDIISTSTGTYIYYNTTWQVLYDDIPADYIKTGEIEIKPPTKICPHCGAPVNSYKCDYCGGYI